MTIFNIELCQKVLSQNNHVRMTWVVSPDPRYVGPLYVIHTDWCIMVLLLNCAAWFINTAVLSSEYRCGSRGPNIKLTDYCNGKVNCPNAEDEPQGCCE